MQFNNVRPVSCARLSAWWCWYVCAAWLSVCLLPVAGPLREVVGHSVGLLMNLILGLLFGILYLNQVLLMTTGRQPLKARTPASPS